MSLQAFFREAAIQPENIRVSISDRFKGEDGKAEQWELRAISETENSRIKDNCTSKVVGKGGRQTTNFNGERYVKQMTAASVVYPDLENAELQKSYAVVGDVELLNAMLLPGEMTTLQELARQVNGYDSDKLEQGMETVKNS